MAVTIAPNVWWDFALGNIIAVIINISRPAPISIKISKLVACARTETSSNGEQSSICFEFRETVVTGIKKESKQRVAARSRAVLSSIKYLNDFLSKYKAGDCLDLIWRVQLLFGRRLTGGD